MVFFSFSSPIAPPFLIKKKTRSLLAAFCFFPPSPGTRNLPLSPRNMNGPASPSLEAALTPFPPLLPPSSSPDRFFFSPYTGNLGITSEEDGTPSPFAAFPSLCCWEGFPSLKEGVFSRRRSLIFSSRRKESFSFFFADKAFFSFFFPPPPFLFSESAGG